METVIFETMDNKNIWRNYIEENRLKFLMELGEIVEKIEELNIDRIRLMKEDFERNEEDLLNSKKYLYKDMNYKVSLYTLEIMFRIEDKIIPLKKMEISNEYLSDEITSFEFVVIGERKNEFKVEKEKEEAIKRFMSNLGILIDERMEIIMERFFIRFFPVLEKAYLYETNILDRHLAKC
ncbi:hypothetical protein [Bacillus thuringiensis]|uniref:Uncharacterized protein n=1 Tax=Bacillus thuringiensis TaxID=1428 RepID=A0A9X6WI37_BACTU|nr:hypothetical protein [Bacillus thuringiensis]PFJ32315.1 hypothetical protein COJ15_29025 [Bacillus thuringiensis]